LSSHARNSFSLTFQAFSQSDISVPFKPTKYAVKKLILDLKNETNLQTTPQKGLGMTRVYPHHALGIGPMICIIRGRNKEIAQYHIDKLVSVQMVMPIPYRRYGRCRSQGGWNLKVA
jgi:hypothetical protein